MRFKLDENLPRELAQRLIDVGHDVDSVVGEGLAGENDPAVLRAARVEDRLLLTLDRGFGDLRRYPPGTHPGIVVLRPDSQDPGSVERLIVRFLNMPGLEDLRGCIVVVEARRLRVRRPEDEDSR